MGGSTGPVLFYDGGCALCHASVRLLWRLDRRARLLFAPLDGPTFAALVPAAVRESRPDSLVFVTGEGAVLVRSAAVLAALRETGGPGRAVAAVARLVPRAVADRLYDAVARARRRLFAPPAEACPLAPGAGRERFRP